MPCKDDRDESQAKENAIGAALACAIMRAAEAQGLADELLNGLDYRRAGITRGDAEAWWIAHKQADTARRKQEGGA